MPQVQRVACSTDEECSAIVPGTVCGTWNGLRGCTIECTNNSMCHLTLAGVTEAFYSCQSDQGGQDREICAPRAACITDPLSCISTPAFPGEPEGGCGN